MGASYSVSEAGLKQVKDVNIMILAQGIEGMLQLAGKRCEVKS